MKPPGDKVDNTLYHQIVITDCIDKQVVERENTCYGKQDEYQVIYQVEEHVARSCSVFFLMCLFIKLFRF